MSRVILISLLLIGSLFGQFITDWTTDPVTIKVPGDVETELICLEPTVTPSINVHSDHGIIYPKDDYKLYYLYAEEGQMEHEFITLTDGVISLGNVDSTIIRINGHVATSHIHTNDITSPPRISELDAIWSSPETGFEAWLDDNNAGVKFYHIKYNGGSWWFRSYTKVLPS